MFLKRKISDMPADVLKIVLSFLTHDETEKFVFGVSKRMIGMFRGCDIILNIYEDIDFIKIKHALFARFRFNDAMSSKCICETSNSVKLCDRLKILGKCYLIKKMFRMKKIHKFYIGFRTIRNMKFLNGVSVVTFNQCDIFARVFPLQGAKNIIFKNSMITFDIGELTNIKSVSFIDCGGFLNMSKIDVQELYVTGCYVLP